MVKDVAPTLAEFEVRTITHALIGGYDASPYSVELDIHEWPRSQAIKGTWRWWLRGLLGGALWRAGSSDPKRLAIDVQEAAKQILGSTEHASKLLLNVDILEDISFAEVDSYGLERLSEGERSEILPPRMFLLQMGQRPKVGAARISCYEPGLSFNIVLKRRPRSRLSEPEEQVALWSLLLSLVFGGVGAITRRGFGALEVRDVKTEHEALRELVEKLKRVSDEESARRVLGEIVNRALQSGHEFLGRQAGPISREVPPFPILVPDDFFRWDVLKLKIDADTRLSKMVFKDTEALALLKRLGSSTMKIEWKRHLGRSPTSADRSLNTWILGLPRFVRREVPTGYFIDERGEKAGRRASSISLRPLRRLEDNFWLITVYGFLSRDWPSQLYHFSGAYGAEPVYKNHAKLGQSVRTAFDQAWEIVRGMLRRKLRGGGLSGG